MLLHVAMIVVGTVAIAWGLPAAHRLRRPFDILAVVAVFAGVVVALLGVLLVAVPEFFKG